MDEGKKIENKVFEMIQQHQMLTPGERVVAGVSGGADSVCLLFMLLEWAKKFSLSIAVVHVNHGIRPDAKEDAAYVQNLCNDWDLPFYLEEADVRQEAAHKKLSEEETGRIVRYRAFEKASKEFKADKIAVAHNRNDLAETMLFHLFRGSGLTGLCGIRPVRDKIIRPILCLERKEIEAYLRLRQIPYCTDSTNLEDDYTRNRIRHHILPYAEERICSAAIGNMARTAQQLLETEDYLQQQTAMAWEYCVQSMGCNNNSIKEMDTNESENINQYKEMDQKEPEYSNQYKEIAHKEPEYVNQYKEIAHKEPEYVNQYKEIAHKEPKYVNQYKEVAHKEPEDISNGKATNTQESQHNKRRNKIVEPSEKSGYILDSAQYKQLHPVIGNRLIYTILRELSPFQKDISSIHVQNIRTLCTQVGNKTIHLPYGIRAEKEYNNIYFTRNHFKELHNQKEFARTNAKDFHDLKEEPLEASSFVIPLEQIPFQKSCILVEGLGKMEFKVISLEELQETGLHTINFKDIPLKECTKWFDYDKMRKSLMLRHRQTGDYLSIRNPECGEPYHKTVKSYMVDHKIPKAVRDKIWLLTQEHHVLWILEDRISEYYKISESTKRILQVTLLKETK